MGDFVAKTLWDTVRPLLDPYQRQEVAAEVIGILRGDPSVRPIPTLLLGDAGVLSGEPTCTGKCFVCDENPAAWRGVSNGLPSITCLDCVSFIDSPELI